MARHALQTIDAKEAHALVNAIDKAPKKIKIGLIISRRKSKDVPVGALANALGDKDLKYLVRGIGWSHWIG